LVSQPFVSGRRKLAGAKENVTPIEKKSPQRPRGSTKKNQKKK